MTFPITKRRIIGLDPGLRLCGWGVIDMLGNQAQWVSHGVIKVPTDLPIQQRLAFLFNHLNAIMGQFQPQEASLEQVFFNSNAQTSLLLGMARGVAAVVPGVLGIPLFEYAPNYVKKAVVGVGHADKQQIEKMIQVIIRPQTPVTKDAADALAVALCHGFANKFK